MISVVEVNMSKSIAVIGSVTTGHDGYPPVKVISGNSRLTINGIPAAVVGSICEDHDKPKHDKHTPVITDGSSRVKVDGIPVATVGSSCSCGDTIATGASLIQIS